MAWIRLDDQIAHHPKHLKCGPIASWLWVNCIGYSNKYLTNGFVPNEAMTTLGNVGHAMKWARKLVEVGLLDKCQGGFQVHDYLDFNESADSIKARRAADRVRHMSRRNPAGVRADSGGIPTDPSRARASIPIPIPREEPSSLGGNGERAVFVGQRFTVYQKTHDKLGAILGSAGDSFSLIEWYPKLDKRIANNGPLDSTWPWIRKRMFQDLRDSGVTIESADVLTARERNFDQQAKTKPSLKANGRTCPHNPACPSFAVCTKKILDDDKRARSHAS